MNNIFRPFKRRIVCDLYGCRNTSEFEIGHPTVRANALHLCRECATSIFNDMKPEFMPVEEVPKKVEKKEEFYECRFCGEKFKKPDELSKYKGHVINCKRRV